MASRQKSYKRKHRSSSNFKTYEELGELSNSVCKGKDIRDDLGDMMVVMINIMKRNNLTMEECLSVAYEDIKNRKGKIIDGVFVK